MINILAAFVLIVLADSLACQASRLWFNSPGARIKCWTILDLIREIKPRPALLGIAHGLIICLVLLDRPAFYILWVAMLLPGIFTGFLKQKQNSRFASAKQTAGYLIPYNLLLGIIIAMAGHFILPDPYTLAVIWLVTAVFASFCIYILARPEYTVAKE